MPKIITSSSNSKIKLVKGLQTRRSIRKAEAAYVVEGVRLLEEAVQVNWPIAFIFFDESLSERGMSLIQNLQTRQEIDIYEITPDLMAEISDTETPQGILAVLEMHMQDIPPSPTFVIIADQIRDPGNMGTLLRTAEAAGADIVLVSPGTVDTFSPKVLRAGMGAHFYLPIYEKPWQEIGLLLKGIPIYLAEAEQGFPLWEADLRQPCALLIGGEAFGASPEGEVLATHKITIPMRGRVESLNAAVAGAILMAEVLRQRSTIKKD